MFKLEYILLDKDTSKIAESNLTREFSLAAFLEARCGARSGLTGNHKCLAGKQMSGSALLLKVKKT